MTRISEFKARAAIALICVLVSALAVTPFFFMGQPLPGGSRWGLRMPVTHDMFLHFDQMRDFYQGLAAGELYPRWEEDTNYGFGAPTTCFYPPGVYYLTALLYPLFHDWTRVLLGTHLLMMLASAAATYLLARRCMSRAAAAVAMIAYVVFPYHAIDQYHREALAELLSFVWMPLILLFVDKLFATTRPLLPAAGLALSYGAFLWSHPPTAYQFTLALCPCLPLLALLRRNWRSLLWVGGGLAVGAGLSAAYLYPAAVEQSFIRHEIIEKIWPYHETYLFMYAGYSKQYFEFFQLLNASWRLEVAVILLAAFTLLVLGAIGKARLARPLRDNIVFWTAIGCFASFLMLHLSAPLGRRIPMIDIGVFAWRMLAITTLVAVLLAGATVQAALDSRRANRGGRFAVFGVLALAILFSGTFFTIFGIMAPVNKQEAFQPQEEHTNYAIIPRTAPGRTDDLPEMDRTSLDGGAGSVTIREWKPQHRVIEVKSRDAARLFVRTFNYPGWTATLDGHPKPLATDGDTGAILLGVPAGEHVVTLDFVDTPARRLGAGITLLSFLSVLAAVAIGAFARRPKETP
ncbi:MAG: hypothetical protein ABSH47_06930 [Bryobacteraceae bacterium]|jgi:hypothetical protein